MVAMAFGIISLLACTFLVYVSAQFHRELTRAPRREKTPHLLSVWLRFKLRDSAVQEPRYRQQVEFP